MYAHLGTHASRFAIAHAMLACGFMIFLGYTTHDEQPIARRRRHSSSSPPAAAPAGVAAAAAAAAAAATVKQPHQQLKQL